VRGWEVDDPVERVRLDAARRERRVAALTFAFAVLVVVIAVAVGVGVTLSNWEECRAAGFSRMYCWTR
jgi:hypothetical protein